MDPFFKLYPDEVDKDLAPKMAESERIGECLITPGVRLKQEPWNWSIRFVHYLNV